MYYIIKEYTDYDATDTIALLETPRTLDIPALFKAWKDKLYEGLIEPEPQTDVWILCVKAGLATPHFAKHHFAYPAFQQWKIEYNTVIQAKKSREREMLNHYNTQSMVEAFINDELIQNQECCRLTYKEEIL